MPDQLVIIGGNAAGLAAALAARRRHSTLPILVLEAGSHVSFGACGMPYNLADPLRDPEDLLVRTAKSFHHLGIQLALRHRVLGVDAVSGSLTVQHTGVETLAIPWDRLVVATGAVTRELVVPGLPPEQIWCFRTLDDLKRLKSRTHPPGRAAIIGAGLVGIEVTEALRSRGIDVLLVDQQELPLAGFPRALRMACRDELERNGVSLSLGSRVVRGQLLSGGALRIQVESPGGTARTEDLQLLINTTGQRPAVDALRGSGVAVGREGAILVDDGMRSSHGRIWAAGDCAARPSCIPPLAGEEDVVWNPQAREALLGGRVAGWNAAGGAGGEQVLPHGPQTLVLRCFSLELARCGRLRREDESAADSTTGPPAPRAAAGLLGMETAAGPSRGRPRAPEARCAHVAGSTLGHAMPGAGRLDVWLEAEDGGRLRGGAILSEGAGAALRINVLAALLQRAGSAQDLAALDLAYSPPFGPLTDPLIRAAERLQRRSTPD